MNIIVAAIAGSVLAAVSAIGGVAAYQGDPAATETSELTKYADE
jgi:hypothetical protein